jgi:DNA primase
VPGLIPDQVLDQVRQGNDVVEVIGSYFPLKRAGANFRALCPFHKEKTPSFNVNPTKQIWHCFGCGAGGDVFTFVMKYENLDFVGAVRRLAERAGIRIELEEAAQGPSRNEKESLLKLHEGVAAWFHANLLKEKSAEVARAYLKKRQISSETAKRWQIGYSPDAWDGLIQWARAKQYSNALLESAGLILPREGGEGFYDRFRGRLMFPVCDEQGRVVGFSGRILTDAKDQPKYVNSPETPIFQKGKILFALDKAKRSIIEDKFAVVCEGQLDTISCHEAGLINVVAPQGTALTEQHARILKRYADEVVLMFDSDTAGKNAAVRAGEPLWDAGFAMRVALLPPGHDPDSFVKEFGAQQLKDLIGRAPTFFVYLLDLFSQHHDPRSDHGRLQIAKQVAEWLVRIPNPVQFTTYAQEAAKRLGLGSSAIEQEILRLRRKLPHLEAFDRSSTLPAEEMLLQLMLADDRAVDFAAERLDRSWLSASTAGELIAHILSLSAEKKWSGAGPLLNELQEEESARLVSKLLLLKPMADAKVTMAAADCVRALERRWLEQGIRVIQKRLAQVDLPSSERDRLLRQRLDLDGKLRNIPALSMETKRSSVR